MKTILLTGGLGYIGSHAALPFLDAGDDVIILDNLSNSSVSVLDAIEKISGKQPKFYEGDIADRALLERIFSENVVDIVIHFAGFKAIGESCEKPFLYYQNNISGSLVLFEVMEQKGVRNLVFSSSATVYDSTQGNGIFTETSPLGTSNPYGTTKLILEYILRDLARNKNWNVVSLRYFNPIGAHPSGLIGEHPKGIPNNLLPYIMDVVSGKREKVFVFGSDYPTADGTGVRDYIDVNDVASAHLMATEWLHKKNTSGIFESFNIGTGRGVSVLELIHAVSEVAGRPIAYEIAARREGDVALVVADVGKMKSSFSWMAQIDVYESVRSSLAYISCNTERFHL